MKIEIKVFESGYDKQEFYGHMGDALTMPEIKREMPYLSNSREMIWFLAFRQGELVGFAAVDPSKTSVTLRNQYVYPDYRKNGVFIKLFKASLDYAVKLNLPINVAVSDKKVLELYRQHGFEETRKTKNYIFMRKNDGN